ncbi:MAG: protein-L-isoaspartate(D-aspartate) O-methyltransferase [Candidatus Omnitrophota bacterium]
MREDEGRFDEERKRMVEEQLILRGIKDPRVLEAFLRVPRHHFVPSSFRDEAYEDHPLAIGYGQTISQPYMVALMTESLKLKGGEKVLEIGTGSGYQAAILSRVCAQVYTIEREQHLYERAREVLSGEGSDNVSCICGDGTNGFPDAAPFDGIIVTAAAPHIPEPLKQQLADGGRLVIPVGPSYTQELILIERKGDDLSQRNICGCIFVPLIGEHGWRV